MSDQLGLTINYEVSLSADNLQAVVCAVRLAVATNWERFQCTGCMQQGGFDDRLYKWFDDILGNKLYDVSDLAEEGEEDVADHVSSEIFITFSPRSSWALVMWVFVDKYKYMGVDLQIDADIRFFDHLYPGPSNVLCSWDINKSCLKEVVDRLVRCLPVRKALVGNLLD